MNLLHIGQILQEECHISPGNRIAVGVSGGADSIALLHILRTLNYPVVALHFNHHIRSEADRDAEFVERLTTALKIRCVIQAEDIPGYATKNHLSLEEAARILRYRFLFSAARNAGADALATAHHANDQAETILMHFMRGSGLDGLKGMSMISMLPEFDGSLPIIRPLLRTFKKELVEYCAENQLEYVEDSSNRDPAYFRNWLRLDLIPKIETFNPRFQKALTKSSRSIQADAEILTRIVDTSWDELGIREGNGYLVLPRMGLTRMENGIRYRIIRKAILRLRTNLRDISFDLVERFVRFIDSPPATHSMDLGAELNLYLVDDQIYLIRHGYSLPPGDFPQIIEPIELPIPSRLTLQNGWEINIESRTAEEVPFDAIRSAGRWEAWMDQDQIQAPLQMDRRSAGDRFTGLGSGGGSMKISDLFINHKIPSPARTNYPLIRDLTRIIWVPGVQIAHHVRVTSATRKILHLRMRKAVPA